MKVTHPEKLLFPDDQITKGEVVEYYQTVSEVMVPQLTGRPLTLERFPGGIGSQGFMQKNAAAGYPDFIQRVEVPKTDGKVNHPVVNNGEGLAYLANQNVITFHIWSSRLPHLDRPDRMTIDLDPPKDDTATARQAANAIGQLFTELGLQTGLMTTGSSGYHVAVPLDGQAQFDVVERASRLLAEVAVSRHPDDLTTEFIIAERQGKVFVDWLRNRWAQSVVSPWSLRPRPRAPVAVPIDWEELEQTPSDKFTIRTAPQRVGLASSWPEPQALPLDAIEELAKESGVSAAAPFDRFGRRPD
jgi:bifunctional non-homologous end joining protein LigD